MKAVSGTATDKPGWVAELKWDGIRTQVSTDGETTMVRSSAGRDITAQFPEFADFGATMATSAVLDGEIVVFDGDRPVFQRVLQRLNVDHPSQALVDANPAVYIAFDLLMLDGNDLLDLQYRDRRSVLEKFLSDGPHWKVPPGVEQGATKLRELAVQRGLEGIMVKRLDSTYKPGARSRDWLKDKIRLRQEFVVGGWLAGQGALENEIGSLMIGVWENERLIMAGTVGSGLTDPERQLLTEQFRPMDKPCFATVPPLDKKPTWVEPTVVVEVEFGDWRVDGMLRHPVYVGYRKDQDPTDVVREIQPPGSTP